MIIMALWKMHLEARTLVIVCMDMNPLLMIMKKVSLKGEPNEEGYQGPPDYPKIG